MHQNTNFKIKIPWKCMNNSNFGEKFIKMHQNLNFKLKIGMVMKKTTSMVMEYRRAITILVVFFIIWRGFFRAAKKIVPNNFLNYLLRLTMFPFPVCNKFKICKLTFKIFLNFLVPFRIQQTSTYNDSRLNDKKTSFW